MLPEANAIEIINQIMHGPPEDYHRIENILHEQNLLVKTDDGSMTLRSEAEGELMHSTIGAVKESFEKFALPSEINKLKEPKVLDLCSGLGYNCLAALAENRKALIDMLEISPEMIFLSRYINNTIPEKEILNGALDSFFLNKKDDQINIYCGDARKLLQERKPSLYDLVFHDGFSPANAPQLYTAEFLTLLYSKMSEHALLLSYSSSIPFRSALINSGFYIGEGPSVGRKRGITLASIKKNDERVQSRLSFRDEKLIALSSIGIPYGDKNFQMTSYEIHNIRQEKRDLYKKMHPLLSTKKINKDLIDPEYSKIYNRYTNSRESILAMNKYLLTKSKM